MTAEDSPTAPRPSLWAAIPPALLVAFAIDLVWQGASACIGRRELGMSWNFGETGVDLATLVLEVAGAFELARRGRGLIAQGARTVGVLNVVALVLVVLGTFAVIAMGDHFTWIEGWYKVMGWAWPAIAVGEAIGYATMAWEPGDGTEMGLRIAGVVAIAISLVSSPFPLWRDAVNGWLDVGTKSGHAVREVLVIVKLVSMFAIAAVAARRSRPHAAEPGRVIPALRTLATSISARLWISASMAALLVLVVLAQAQSAASLMTFAALAVPVINLIALVAFGVATLAFARGLGDGEPRVRLYVAAALTFGPIMIMATQTAWLVRLALTHDGTDSMRDMVNVLPLATPAMIATGVLLVVSAIAAVAADRDQPALASSASTTLAPYAVLIGCALLMQTYGLPEVETLTGFVGVTVTAATCGLIALVLVVRLCRRAANDLENLATLPTATLVDRS